MRAMLEESNTENTARFAAVDTKQADMYENINKELGIINST